MRYLLISFLGMCITGSSLAQNYLVNPPEYIKTVNFEGRDTKFSQFPILRLGEALRLQFDVLDCEEEDYYYSIEHYNKDWTKSALLKSEFLSGLDKGRITNYENSFNTYQTYCNYKLQIPNRQTKALTKSGNYSIIVKNEYDDVIFSLPFVIFEPLVNVGLQVKRDRELTHIEENQCVDISLNTKGLNVVNPRTNISVLILQNSNLSEGRYLGNPQFTLANQLIYRNNRNTCFKGGNEFFNFENKRLRVSTLNIKSVELADLYQYYLYTDIPRKTKSYTYFPDINGGFLINAENVSNVDVEADYAEIHFSLKNENLGKNQKVYVFGKFNNFALNQENQMVYNEDLGVYYKSLLLKQGFYNYKYVVVNENNKLSHDFMSGSFWQTENAYQVLVYYRELGGRYDRVLGFGEANSEKITN